MSLISKVKKEYNEIVQLFNMFNIKIESNKTKILDFSYDNLSYDFKINLSSGSYIDIYKNARKNYDYDFLIEDNSFFQFTYVLKEQKIRKLRYAFYECPFNVLSYDLFLTNVVCLDKDEIEKCGLELYDEYQQYISEGNIKSNILSLRYDYDETLYNGLIHPVSHLHIGLNNEIRIPINSLLSPKCFASQTIKYIYYNDWKEAISDKEKLDEYLKVKHLNSILVNDLFNQDEKNDIYLS